ncbi:MAG: lspA, partial [Gemmatimonadetes bacterium]|nr:lspA [Gemmatimonadota bacterium]
GAFWSAVAAAVAVDAATKWWAFHALVEGKPWPREAFPRFRLAFNTNLNAGLTIPGGGRVLYSLIGIALMIALLVAVARTPRSARAHLVGFGMTFGGGTMNAAERMVRGSVTDFIDFGYGSFNVADIMIACGVLVYLSFRVHGKHDGTWILKPFWDRG